MSSNGDKAAKVNGRTITIKAVVKKYFDSLKDYKGGLLFVGVNYDEKDKAHECRIERFTKE